MYLFLFLDNFFSLILQRCKDTLRGGRKGGEEKRGRERRKGGREGRKRGRERRKRERERKKGGRGKREGEGQGFKQ